MCPPGPGRIACPFPFHVTVKPAGAACNLRCTYCHYLEKRALFPASGGMRMSAEVLDRFTREYIRAQPEGVDEVCFAWQGGEPTLCGLDFFQSAVEAQKRHARAGMAIQNALQTNGVLINDDWAAFLARERFLVGLSLDGPENLHDLRRVDAEGRGTFRCAMRGLEALRKKKAEVNALTVIHRENGDFPELIYRFLREAGFRHMQFIPLVAGGGSGSGRSVEPAQYGRFLAAVFDLWLRRDVGRVFVRSFDAALAAVLGYPSSQCVTAETCGRTAVLEHNGDLFPCDFFVTREDRLGNLAETALADLICDPRLMRFGKRKRDALPPRCLACEYLELCRGGCPAHRTAESPDSLCEGYRLFYGHAMEPLAAMARAIRHGQEARDYSRFLQKKPG